MLRFEFVKLVQEMRTAQKGSFASSRVWPWSRVQKRKSIEVRLKELYERRVDRALRRLQQEGLFDA